MVKKRSRRPDRSKRDESIVRNDVAASVTGSIVQSGSHMGDINLYSFSKSVSVPRQLPAAPRWFTGRDVELRALTEAMDYVAGSGRPVVISAVGGTGGIGKTWLGLYWAHQNVDLFPDGQLFVNLRGFDPALSPMSSATAVRGFLDAFEVEVNRIPVDVDAQIGLYRSIVSGRRMLIFLDNAYDAEQVLPLLPGSSSCMVIVTSRHRLSSLISAHDAQPLQLGVLADLDARGLLARRIESKRAAEEPEAINELTAYCAGLPLALGIVAARAVMYPHLSLAVLAAELRERSSRLAALDGGDVRSNLGAVFSWSYRALSPGAARIFCLLGLAPGADISLGAAVSLVDEPAEGVQHALRELDRASLVQHSTSNRWRMHDLVKLYAVQQASLVFSDEVQAAALRRLVEFYLHTTHAADRLINPRRPSITMTPAITGVRLESFPNRELAQQWLSDEHSCLLAAHNLARSQGWWYAVWRLAWSLDTFHYRRGLLHDRIVTLESGLDAAQRDGDSEATFMAHRLLGHAYVRVDRYEKAIDHLDEALAMARESGDSLNEAHTHTFFIKAWGQQGNDQRALDHALNALRLFRLHDNPSWEIQSLNFVGWYSARLGRHDQALLHCSRALVLSRNCKDRQGEADALNSLGYLAHLKDNNREAIGHYLQALGLFHELGHDYYEAEVLDRLGEAYEALGEHAPARDKWRQALRLYQEHQRTVEAERVLRKLTVRDIAIENSGSPTPTENT